MNGSEIRTRRLIGALLCTATFLLCSLSLSPRSAYTSNPKSENTQKPQVDPRGQPGIDEEESDAIQERIKLYQRRHGVLAPESRLRFVREEYQNLEAEKARRAQEPSVEPTWVSLGPTNGAGRMSCITPHPTAMGTVYAGADGGGAWKTTDAGASWVSLTNSINNLNVGAIALAPSSPNIVYLGTGSEHSGGIGLLKSTDGGATWLFPASVVANRFFRISVHPTHPLELVAATDQGGLRSIDGGSSWTLVIPNLTVTDLARDPTNAQILYATTWGCPESICYGQVFKSIDAGATWVEKSSGLPATEGVSYMAIAISSTNPLVLYTSLSIYGISHIYKTTNGAQTWADLPAVSTDPNVNQYMDGQAFHDNTIVVSPTDSNLVIAAGVHYFRSTDGGSSWVYAYPSGSPHADATDLQYQGSTLYTANDGGVWSIANSGLADAATSRNNGLVAREYYAMAIDQVNRNRVLAGAQDNGTDRRPDTGGTSWTEVFPGDGFDCAVNCNVTSIAYWTYQGGIIFRTKDAANADLSNFTGAIEPFYPSGEGGGFGTIVTMDTTNPSTLYTATYRVWRTTNGGDSWAPLPTTTIDGSTWSSTFGADISAIAVAPNNNSILMVTKYDPNIGQVVFRSVDGGATWTRGAASPEYFFNLEIDPRDSSLAYGASLDSSGNSVYMTTNGGISWTPRSAGLPPFPTQVVRVDPSNSNILYCGNDAGVYRSTDQGLNWARYGVGLPSVSVDDLRLLDDGSILRVATYGRGVWEIQFPTGNTPPSATITSPAASLRVTPGTLVSFQGFVSDTDGGDAATGTWVFTDTGETISAGNGTSNVSHTFNRAGRFPVALAAKDTHAARGSASVVIDVYEPFDSCSSPAIIPGSGPFPYSVTANDETATSQASDPISCSGSTCTLWFEFTPSVTGTYQVSVARRPFNVSTTLSIWTGPKCGPYSPVSGGCSTDEISISAQAGVTLRIMADGQGPTYGRTLSLTVTSIPVPCNYALSSMSQSLTPAGGSSSVDLTSPSGCGWTAISNANWITLQSGSDGAGDGTVNYFVAANSGPARTGTITIAGKIFTVYQGMSFLDVPSNHPFYIEISKLSGRGITLGCGSGNFCPNDPVTREQMAAFILRAKGEFNPPTPPSQRFNDVPSQNVFYDFIDRLAVLQITLGCTPDHLFYCPSDPVKREQMAAFLLRGLGEFNPPTPPGQRFNDVPPQNVFYNFIDRLAVLEITLGCTPDHLMYCPSDSVTRAQMAAFLVRAFDL